MKFVGGGRTGIDHSSGDVVPKCNDDDHDRDALSGSWWSRGKIRHSLTTPMTVGSYRQRQ